MLPYLQSYTNPKKDKAYRRYMDGESQRKISKALKIPGSTLALWSKKDGWEDERKSRKISESAEAVSAAAAAGAGADGAASGAAAQPEDRRTGMQRMLARQQRLTGRLVEAYEQDVDKTLADAKVTGRLTRSQIAQLTMLGNNLMAMERKAWCVPDKIETTGKNGGPIEVRDISALTDEELDAELARMEAEAAGAAPGTR